ncbi:MAG: acetyl/propionyl/methylcrotonyl-CoA carboxylase subunit alpha [Sphingorhabdus sp.]
MIKSLLIANRGEIACRIIRTARAMGIRTIAVYSDADAKALHVRQADEAVHIGASPAAESYLVGAKIIAAAKESNAEAIHPGYGFLSENADFAQAVIDAGLIWVGPKPDSIRAMGLKDAAKTLMEAAGVPTTPGYIGDNQDAAFLAKQAAKIGYPVLIKAVAGGGGKGMRKVDAASDFADSLASCQREAKASFGNDIVLIEKWIESPRHIEVQIFGDSHGNVIHLFERDCSLQRRHQKVIEEAPAPGMDEKTREAICAAAVKAAKAVDYENAGTIEFIADASDGLRADRIWFMEMNTRLQVEHPVTEEITGVDLVEWQLRVASGEALPKKQDELSINGHAIEARLYAEDPAKGFLPSVGRLEVFTSHPDRLETGVSQGDEISPFYDPMIAKLVIHKRNRLDAIDHLVDACAETAVWPVATNATFLACCLVNKQFRSGNISTSFIGDNEDLLVDHGPILQRLCETVPAAIMQNAAIGPKSLWGNFSESISDVEELRIRPSMLGWRLNSEPRSEFYADVGDGTEVFQLERNWKKMEVKARPVSDGFVLFHMGKSLHVRQQLRDFTGTIAASDGAILSPMPGRIISVDVAAGDSVTKGQKLLTLEAMKMEHTLTAPFDGVVAELNAEAGAQVQVEALLAKIEVVEE